ETTGASGRHAGEITEDPRALPPTGAGRLSMQQEEFALDDMLADLADVVAVRAGAKAIEVLFVPAADVPRRLFGDPVRLKQVLLNLLGNATKFTDKGEIAVSIDAVEVRRERTVLTFVGKDTGIGISPADLARIFESLT